MTAPPTCSPTAVEVGDGANLLAITPDGTVAYVDDCNAGTVSVIHTSDNIVIDSINDGILRPNGVAVTPDGRSEVAGVDGWRLARSMISQQHSHCR